MKRIQPLPYFNTNPHYLRQGKYLYVMHARAMAFSYDQASIFEQLKQIAAQDQQLE